MSDGELILVAGALLAAGIAGSLLAARVRLPGLLLFLALGMVIGSDGAGWIEFGRGQDDYEFARTIGVVALALILFEGGLTAGFDAIRPVLRPALGLALVGTFVTAAITGLAAAWLFGFSTLEGLLLGSIIASTDGAAVFSILRGSTLRRRLAHTLEGEAGFNDPVAVLLVIGFVEWIQEPDYGLVDMALLFGVEVGIGLAAGVAVGWLSVQGLRRARLDTPGLYPVATLASAALAFGVADALHGSGFLAVYLAGLALGSANIPAKRTVTVFHQGLGWVAQIVMFLALGLLVFPSRLDDVWVEGTVLALVLLFVARPVATFAGTALDAFSVREKIVLGWAGLRGAVPVVLATFPVIDACPGLRGRLLQHHLLRGGALHAVAGSHVRASGRPIGRDHERTRAAPAAGRDRHDPAPRGRDHGVPGGLRRRHRRPAGARAGTAARRAGHRDRARERGRAAARVDARGGR